jgi:hypothetical protein
MTMRMTGFEGRRAGLRGGEGAYAWACVGVVSRVIEGRLGAVGVCGRQWLAAVGRERRARRMTCKRDP